MPSAAIATPQKIAARRMVAVIAIVSPLVVRCASPLHAPHDALIAALCKTLTWHWGRARAACYARHWRRRMDGTPLKARHPLSPEICHLITEHRPGGPLERDFYVDRQVFDA